jgi:isopentenyl-diphosphate Delta-isomerase
MTKELVVYVDEQGKPTGETEEKYAAHHGSTKLHSAFSCYVFNDNGQLLVTKRAAVKKVWPGVWTNTVCGHPLPKEERAAAIKRRLDYELGAKADSFKEVLPNYRYTTPPFRGIIENEFCPVFVAKIDGGVKPNPSEVSDYKWLSWQEFILQTSQDGNDYSSPGSSRAPVWSWWCKDQLKQLVDNETVKEYTKN